MCKCIYENSVVCIRAYRKGDKNRIYASTVKRCVQAIAFCGVVHSVSKYINLRGFFSSFIVVKNGVTTKPEPIYIQKLYIFDAI